MEEHLCLALSILTPREELGIHTEMAAVNHDRINASLINSPASGPRRALFSNGLYKHAMHSIERLNLYFSHEGMPLLELMVLPNSNLYCATAQIRHAVKLTQAIFIK